MAVAEVTKVKLRGCYSVRYMVDDPMNHGLELAMDYTANQWKCLDTEVGTIHWMSRRMIPDHGLNALLDHFGLTREDLCLGIVFVLGQSPADLVCTRRAKEQREGLDRKEIKNMRLGCHPDELLPDAFERAA